MAMMDLSELKQILEMVREHDLTELEIEQDGVKVRVRKDGLPAAVPSAQPPPVASPQPSVAAAAPGSVQAPAVPVAVPAPPATAPAPVPDAVELAVVKSPIVGTFYRAPEPGAPPFVDVGARVRKGQVLCIIEAMKLMNEIESEYQGEIVTVYVENGQPVQFGERLFAIRAT